jgi:aspartate aminotransferase
MLSKRAQLLQPSPTLKMSARANELKSTGINVINLTVGEPDWNTFASAKSHGILAIQNNMTRYTPAAGTPALRSKLALFLSDELKCAYKPEQIAVGPGAKFLLFAAFQMLLDEGDEVLLPAPYWVSYPTMIELSSGITVVIQTTSENRFKPKISQLEDVVTEKTKLLVLCSPNNPTGTALNTSEIQDIISFLKKHPKITLISDDIYNRLYFQEGQIAPHILHLAPELQDRVICIGGASKSFAMTGWRIGWMAANKNITSKVSDYLSQTTSNPSSISQQALLGVLEDFQGELQKSLAQLKQKKKLVEELLNKYHIPYVEPDGAFYFFIQVSLFFGKRLPNGEKIQNSSEFSEHLLNSKYVATVPGSDFGMEGWIRISFASSNASLEDGIKRIGDFLGELK